MLRRLLYLNSLAIIGVVLFHAAGMGFVAMFDWAERHLPAGVSPQTQIGSLDYFLLRFFEQVAVFSIAAFLFISGYFISIAAGKQQENTPWSVVFARIRTLLIPYLFWSLVTLLLQFVLEGRRVPLPKIIVGLFIGRTNEVFYFVPLLIQFYLLAPLFVWAARRNWKLLLTITAIIQVIYILLPYSIYLNLNIPQVSALWRWIPKWLFVTRIFWFTLGIVVGFHLESVKKLLDQFRRPILFTALVCIPLGILEWELFFRLSGQTWLSHYETLLDLVYSLAVIASVLAFANSFLPFTRRLENFGRVSYGIYLTHFLFIEYTAKIIYRTFPQLLGNQFLLLPLLILVGLGGPMLIMALFNRSPAQQFFTYIFG